MPRKALVVDDDPFACSLLRHLLRMCGIAEVWASETGAGALERIDQMRSPEDVILIDLNMPEMDGLELVRHLVDQSFKGGIIVVSGEGERVLDTAVNLVRLSGLSALGYLRKPISPLSPRQLSDLLTKSAHRFDFSSPAIQHHFSREEIEAGIDGGQLLNLYQPQVSARTGQVVGCEALVRWSHPHQGLITPDRFVHSVEEYGLSDKLTRAVLVTALRQLTEWRRCGLALRMSINVSMDNLVNLGFPQFVSEAVAYAQLPPEALTLEVTESRLMTDPRRSLEVLARLRLKHFDLSIDDFGAGYSSLAQLRHVPFAELKVDKEFVHGASHNPTLRTILTFSESLAHQLGMRLVAEGVEDVEDWTIARKVGCDVLQGYFIARPMAGPALPAWAAGWEIHRQKPIQYRDRQLS